MKISAYIVLLLSAIALCTPATRADDLSDLVAAVAGRQPKHTMEGDVRIIKIDTLPKYKPAAKIDQSLIEGIYTEMMILSSLDYALNITDEKDSEYARNLYKNRSRLMPPTLAREGFFRPVPGIITSQFGWRPQFNRLHHGIDLHLNIGDTVRAAISGRVEKISYDHNGYGHYVVVSNQDEMETIYGHLQYALVSQGQYISSGEPIAIGGNTGNSTGPHLHFEARISGVAIDPTLLFDFYSNGYYNYGNTQNESLSFNHGPVYSHQSNSISGKSTYIVRYGDTLNSIAHQAGISVTRLCQLNMIHEYDPLPVGRMIKIK